MAYRDKPSSLREIGKALGVGAILEGSVRKIGNRVRVNVQLINAENDQHLWAEDYDQELTDVFAIQTDLADVVLNAVGEIGVFLFFAQVLKGQDGERFFGAMRRGARQQEEAGERRNPEAKEDEEGDVAAAM